MKRIGIIGSGNVGATAAYYIAEKVIADRDVALTIAGIPRKPGMDRMDHLRLSNDNPDKKGWIGCGL